LSETDGEEDFLPPPEAPLPGAYDEDEGDPAIGADRPARLQDVFSGLTESALGDRISVGAIIAALAHRSYRPLLLLPALISVLPVIGAIPGVTWTMAALCLFISLHFAVNRRSLWLPRGLKKITLSAKTFERSVGWAMPTLRWIDRLTHPRFKLFLAPPWPFLIAILCVALSLAMFATSLFPGGVVIPATGVILIAIGLTTHDGLVLLFGALASAAAFWGVYAIIT
jgi:hypothetical protein